MKTANQPIILNIETSTNVCSVSVSQGINSIFSIADAQGQNHAALLSVFVEQALQIIRQRAEKPNAVAVSAGPGSYTGLRIGVSTAKGLCFGFEIPLLNVDTLQVMFEAARRQIAEIDEYALFCPMIDARRMEVYDAIYQADGTVFRPTVAEVITENSFAEILRDKTVHFFGNGAEKCKSLLQNPNSQFIDNIVPLAENMCELSLKKFLDKNFADTAYFEPLYLKEFMATKAKNLLNIE
ncbi:MAG: tRNA (adenosine(37)-N6)-threonylcarbamoyltransferase complex dimerization subunit type 1 TsaB [Prevotellaceae bacterium]|jgi:tRNA threonylcarbamoyladenosine biosynthesis protein TsaB|nr:tRNA (adenosine(37)-N6)-threonylcarbamoyltransferase complex dimerization subunit type 1 TsaB [Prevotellaceae bacterium]